MSFEFSQFSQQDLLNIEKIKKYNADVMPLARIGFSSLCGLNDLNIEIAPTQYSGGTWDIDIKLPEASSYQSLFFNTTHNLFRSLSKWTDHLRLVDSIAKANNCPYLVLGSPAARNSTGDYDCQITDLKRSEYYLAGALAELGNVSMVALEANPAIYNSNVCVNAKSTIEVVKLARSLGNEHIYFHLDSGCLKANEEDPIEVLNNNIELIKRIHISEAGLGAYLGGEAELIDLAIQSGIGISLEQKANQTGFSLYLQQVAAVLEERKCIK